MVMEDYFLGIEKQYKTGHAKEHGYRPDLKVLFEKILVDVTATNDPKRSEYGAPDFIFTKGEMIYGYAEAKDIDVDISFTAKSEQLSRYFGYSNLILTNYIDFRFYRNGEEWCDQISIAHFENGVLVSNPENYENLVRSIKDFYNQAPERIRSASRLTKIMGGRARRIRDNVSKYLESENDRNLDLIKMYEVIKQNLIHDISHLQFADMYAQTLVYGLFVARYHDTSLKTFSRQEARDLIPASNPFLQHFFDHLAGASFDIRLRYIVDELCEIFAVSDVKDLMNDYKRDRDPVIHFYEDFLFEYDNGLRKKMGVFYTPAPVVSFIIRAVDEVLKKDFNLTNGIADTSKIVVEDKSQKQKYKKETHRVQILDPATGTGTFLNEIIKYIHASYFSDEQGLWNSYVNKDLLPRLHGFELMMASYTIAHLKLAMTLKDTGVEEIKERVGVYLTNSLEEAKVHPDDLFGSFGLMDTITKESSEASRIKSEYPVMVVIGNPPYSGVSSNNFEHANRLVDKYKVEAGGKQKLQERNSKWLNDDYVKFIAFAEDLIIKNEEGVLGFITSHSYLDNPTFRGMRWKLAQTFDEIYIIDLHGSSKKKEIDKDGGKDENVFDIQQGVAIMIGVKKKETGKKKDAKVFVADLYGKKNKKFEVLNNNEIKYTEIKLDPYQYYFVIKSNEGKEEYEKGISVVDLFPINSVGVVTAKDAILINENKNDLLKNVSEFYKIETQEKLIQSISYRPFDNRYIYYDTKLVERSRGKVMINLIKESFKNAQNNSSMPSNLGLVFCKQIKTGHWNHIGVSNNMIESSLISNKTGEINYVAPAYVIQIGNDGYYPNIQLGHVSTNLDQSFMSFLYKNNIYSEKESIDPVSVIDYIYAVLHSPKYRETYKEFLKIDFPHVPYPKNKEEFWSLVKFGTHLRELHLLESKELEYLNLGITFIGEGDIIVDKPTWKENRIYINKEQYFDSVSKEVFDFYIGGYQPAQKWLKDRKGKTLTSEDIIHYKKMCVAMRRTMEIMVNIDEVI